MSPRLWFTLPVDSESIKRRYQTARVSALYAHIHITVNSPCDIKSSFIYGDDVTLSQYPYVGDWPAPLNIKEIYFHGTMPPRYLNFHFPSAGHPVWFVAQDNIQNGGFAGRRAGSADSAEKPKISIQNEHVWDMGYLLFLFMYLHKYYLLV